MSSSGVAETGGRVPEDHPAGAHASSAAGTADAAPGAGRTARHPPHRIHARRHANHHSTDAAQTGAATAQRTDEHGRRRPTHHLRRSAASVSGQTWQERLCVYHVYQGIVSLRSERQERLNGYHVYQGKVRADIFEGRSRRNS